jgi:predicted ATPase
MEAHFRAREVVFQAAIALGEVDDVLGELESFVELNPERQAARGLLMRALYWFGREEEAIATYRESRTRLVEELGLEPTRELQQLEVRILQQDPLLKTAGQAVSGNLPLRADCLVGRATELTVLGGLLSERRLVTITGMGGVGKTTIAIEAARDPGSSFIHGKWLVRLADVNDPDLVASEIASALGIALTTQLDRRRTLEEAIGESSMLLLLDNCEHVLEGAARTVDSILRVCPNARVLATSREPLGLRDECTWRLDPLAVAPHDGEERSAAVELFLDRSNAADPSWNPTPSDISAIRDITIWAGGVPLAIEMTAARVRSMSPRQILERLGEPTLLRLGGPATEARHRSMDTTLGWSFDLLSEDEAFALARATVFRGSFDLEAAEAILVDDRFESGSIAHTLDRLVSTSLLASERSPANRYRMLEPIREYMMRTNPIDQATSRRHASHFAALAEKAGRHMPSGTAPEWPERIRLEYPNLRAALQWSIDRSDASLGLQLGQGLSIYWARQGLDDEANRWLMPILRLQPADPPSRDLAVALDLLAAAYIHSIKLEKAEQLLKQQVRVAQSIGDRDLIALSYWNQANLAMAHCDYDLAASLFAETAQLTEEVDEPLHLTALMRLSEAYLYLNRPDDAATIARRAKRTARSHNNRYAMALAASTEADAAGWIGDYQTASELHYSAWKTLKPDGPTSALFWIGKELVLTSIYLGDLLIADYVLAEADEMNRRLEPDQRGWIHNAWLALVRAELALARADPADCVRECLPALRWFRDNDPHLPSIIYCVELLGRALIQAETPTPGIQILTISDRLRHLEDIPRSQPDLQRVANALHHSRDQLSKRDFDSARKIDAGPDLEASLDHIDHVMARHPDHS